MDEWECRGKSFLGMFACGYIQVVQSSGTPVIRIELQMCAQMCIPAQKQGNGFGFFPDRDWVAVTRHMWASSRFFFEIYCPDRSSGAKFRIASGAKFRIAAGPQSANRVIFCDCRHSNMKSSVKLPFYYLLVKGGQDPRHSYCRPVSCRGALRLGVFTKSMDCILLAATHPPPPRAHTAVEL